MILLPLLKFPEHWMVQDWLSNTEYGEEFDLVLTEMQVGKSISRTVPALRPKTEKSAFYWTLRGDKGSRELEQKVLDYASKIKYNI